MADKKSKNWKAFQEQHIDNDVGEDVESDEAESSDEAHQEALEYPDYKELQEQLMLAEKNAHENWEKCVRAQAELDNVRRRAEQEVKKAVLFGNEALIKSFLEVAESLGQAVLLAEKSSDESMKEGLQLTLKLLLNTFEKHGVEQINPEGQPFNPEEQEAMMMQPSAEVPPNTVLSVFQKGYRLNGRVIRPARVIVSKGE